MAVFDPIKNTLIHDYVILGGKVTPGIASIEGLTRKSKWDVKDGQGQKGAKITYLGEITAKFKVKVVMWESKHFDSWESEMKPILERSKNPPHPSIDIWHPECVDAGVKSVVVEDYTPPKQNGDGWEATVSVIEFAEPKPDFGTAKGGLSSAVGNAKTKEDKTNPLIAKQDQDIQFAKDELARRRAARKP